MAARWALLVTKGVNAGACLALDAELHRIGRSGDSDLVLGDRGVSRRHLEVTTDAEGVTVRCVTGAAPFSKDGRDVTEAHLTAGGVIVIGDTALTLIADDRGAGGGVSQGRATDTRTLLGGNLAADVRGLAAVVQLVESLDTARSLDDLAEQVAAWCTAHVHAVNAVLLPKQALAERRHLAQLAAEPWALVETTVAGGAREIATGVHGGGALVIQRGSSTATIDDDLRRLLAVAARLVSSALAHLNERSVLEDDVSSLRELALGSARGFLGSSPAAEQVARIIPKLAASDSTALVIGESGTGKTFLARLIHEASPRAKEPLRVINCAAIPENLLESELFGHERGAFTGALAGRAGAFEAVGRGTLLLDEIGELPLTSQAKLLRVLEDRRYERVGSNKSLTVDARILAATNRDLAEMVEKGTFRRDLFFRVSVVSVTVPPLRDRGDDVLLLARQLLGDLAGTAGRRVTGFSKSACELLLAYPWPGNVRELRNAIEHALVLGDGAEIEPGDLPSTLRAVANASTRSNASGMTAESGHVQLPAKLDWLEERAIEAALVASGGNRTKAAAILGINRVTLYKKLRVTPPAGDED